MGWVPGSPGVVELAPGLLVRGRRLAVDLGPADLTLVLGRGPAPAWAHRRLRWPDFWVPLDRAETLETFEEAYGLARSGRRVEVACHGGVGRTGTALAALAVLDGTPSREAVARVRERYHRGAVETPWQRHWLQQLPRRP